MSVPEGAILDAFLGGGARKTSASLEFLTDLLIVLGTIAQVSVLTLG